MNKNWTLGILFSFFGALLPYHSQAQFTVTVTVDNATVNTQCNDIFSTPDPTVGVNVEGGAYTYYSDGNNCFEQLPFEAYQNSFLCFEDVPPTIQVCFDAFENDPSLFDPCTIGEDCLETICGDFPIPPIGFANYQLVIPPGGESDGIIDFTISADGLPGAANDLPCDAFDAGILDFQGVAGDTSTSVFNNFCATNDNEPNDFLSNGFFNNNGVWFKFTTSSTPGAVHKIIGISDPSGLGDDMGLQIAITTPDNGDCTQPISIEGGGDLNGSVLNEALITYCLEPDQEYLILVDGDAIDGTADSDSLFGYFGLEIRDLGATQGADLICDATDLGVVPDGGTVSTDLLTNGCATNTGDPFISGLFNARGVWVQFTPPATGNVQIDVLSDPNGDDDLNVEFGVISSDDGTCNGNFTKITSSSIIQENSESVILPCLNPGEPYWILIDGQGASELRKGIFQVVITDLGENTPVLDQDITLCDGESISVGFSTYDESGIYSDTIILASGCDSIVNTNLTILPPLIIDINIDQPAINENESNGIATASALGGSETDYTYLWSHGETTANVTNLIGEQTYCVTVTDGNNCVDDTCFVQPLVLDLIPVVPNDSLLCFGDSNGELSISAFAGLPPYSFQWENIADASINGNGTLNQDLEIATFTGLPAGEYSVTISDFQFDTTIIAEIWQPEIVDVDLVQQINNSCFAACDASLSITGIGGTPPYTYNWNTGETTPDLNTICAGTYTVTVTDSNNCTGSFDFDITEPVEIVINAFESQEVSCFGGSDGIATVLTPTLTAPEILWNNGETTPIIENLVAGTYSVTITDEFNCTVEQSIIITEPNAPLTVSISILDEIICGGSNEGALQAEATGPAVTLTYEWSDGNNGPVIDQLFTGNYEVTATNDKGCTANATVFLDEPPEIFAELSVFGVTCFGGQSDGIITIDTAYGGVGNFEYSIDGINFSDIPEIINLTAGDQTVFVQDEGGCVRGFSIEVPDIPFTDVEITGPSRIELGDVVDLGLSPALPDLSYFWSASDPLNCDTCMQVQIVPTNTTEVSVTALDEATGCSTTNTFEIEVVKKLKFYTPNVFSPNADGINDYFYLQAGPDVALIKAFQVFDRNGGRIFEATNFLPNVETDGWDGKFHGQLMNSGVYAWFAEVEFIDGTVEVFSGDVTLFR